MEKILGVDNVEICHCEFFWFQIHYILAWAKKIIAQIWIGEPIREFELFLDLSFLPRSKYNEFGIKICTVVNLDIIYPEFLF